MKQLADSNTRLVEVLRGFDKNPVRAGRELRDALHADSQALFNVLLSESGLEGSARGVRYAMLLLLHNDVLIPSIANPGSTSLAEAVGITRYMLKLDSNFINSMLTALLIRPDLIRTSACTLRVLDIVASFVSHLGNWRSITRIHQSGDAQIKAKCAGLIAQYRFEDPAGLERFCSADARVRANIVEILWSVDRSRAKNLLEAATQDGSNRVAGNAWFALYSEGHVRALNRLAAMLESKDLKQQLTAAWVMGQTRDGRFAGRLLEASRSGIPELRKTAFSGLSRLEPMPKPGPDAFTPRPDDREVGFVSATEDDEVFEVWLRVADASGEFTPTVKPVDFFVWAEDEPLLDHSVELISRVHNAAIGIVYPAASEVLVRAIRESLAIKAPGHRWALCGYGTRADAPCEPPSFEADPHVLAAVLGAGQVVNVDAEKAVRSVLDIDPKLPERHIVLILDGAGPDPDPETVLSLCRENRFRLHCWRFRQGACDELREIVPVVPSGCPDNAEDTVQAVPEAYDPPTAEKASGGAKPRGTRKFWEIDEDVPPAQLSRKSPENGPARPEQEEMEPCDSDSKGGNPGVAAPGADKSQPVLRGIVRDEEHSASMWPNFVASLSSRYVLRSQRRPTAVSIRLAVEPARFSAFTRLLKGVANGRG
jgi:hypothetical protein